MARSFDLADNKLWEADFFVEKMDEAGSELFEARAYFSAFAAASRSITFALQAVMKDVPGFDAWYHPRRERLKNIDLARFFVEARNVTQKTGEDPLGSLVLRAGRDGNPVTKLFFRASSAYSAVPEEDAVTACKTYLTMLVTLVLECYEGFGRTIDPEQFYTKEAFNDRGLTIDDADEELFGIRGWTSTPGILEAARRQILRDSMPGCRIDQIFEKDAERSRTRPARIPASRHLTPIHVI